MEQILIVDTNGDIVDVDQVKNHELDGSVVDNENGTFTVFKQPTSPLNKIKFDFTTEEFIEGKSDADILFEAKQAKIQELDGLCSVEILQGFTHNIDGVIYHFSLSINAQSNLQETGDMFKEAAITSEKWTVLNTETGKIERISLDETTFNEIRSVARNIVRDNVSKFRDDLQPQVEAVEITEDLQTALDEVNNINW